MDDDVRDSTSNIKPPTLHLKNNFSLPPFDRTNLIHGLEIASSSLRQCEFMDVEILRGISAYQRYYLW